MNKKWKNIKLKSSGDKKEKVVFTENAIKIIENKQIKEIFNYSEIIECNLSLNVYRFYNCGRNIFATLNKYPDMHNLSLFLDIKTKDFYEYSVSLRCSIKTAFDILKLNNLINNFNFKIAEEECIKNCVAIPLTLYALTGKKFNILGNPLSLVELFIFSITIIPLLFMLIPAYCSGNLNLDNYYFIEPFFLVGAGVSLFGVVNEIKKLSLRKVFSQNNLLINSEIINQFGEVENSIITSNKVNISPAVYKYIYTNRYLSLIFFIINICNIIFTTLKVFYY